MSHRLIAAGIVLLALLTACSSNAPAGATPTPKSSAVAATGTPVAETTPAVSPQVTAAGTTQAPPVTPGASTGSDLTSRFPATIDGQPLSSVSVGSLLDYQRLLGAPEAQIAAVTSTLAGVGIDAATVSIGLATANVDGSPVSFSALFVPGHDAATLIPIRQIFTSTNQGDVLSEETVGGKSVSVVRSEGGFASAWMYPNGDALWFLSTSSADDAAAVFSALP